MGDGPGSHLRVGPFCPNPGTIRSPVRYMLAEDQLKPPSAPMVRRAHRSRLAIHLAGRFFFTERAVLAQAAPPFWLRALTHLQQRKC